MSVLVGPVQANDTDPNWVPITITATFTDPIVGFRDDLGIDGPLSYAMYRRLTPGEQEALPPMNPNWALDFDLPIARWSAPAPDGLQCDERLLTVDGEVWGWCTSDPVVTGNRSEVATHIRRKPELEAMARWSNAKRHHSGLGPLKARNITHEATFASQVKWHALGDPEKVQDLLSEVIAIGRATRHGNGRVGKWTVDAHSDRDAWRTRAMPATGGSPTPVRAPAYHRSRLVPCL